MPSTNLTLILKNEQFHIYYQTMYTDMYTYFEYNIDSNLYMRIDENNRIGATVQQVNDDVQESDRSVVENENGDYLWRERGDEQRLPS